MKDPKNDRGSGTVLAIALVGATVALALIAVPLYSALVARQSVSAAADAAALAAADVAVGIVPGLPCERAAEVVAANGFALQQCVTDGLVVTVIAGGSVLGFPLTAAATAGPPLGEPD